MRLRNPLAPGKVLNEAWNRLVWLMHARTPVIDGLTLEGATVPAPGGPVAIDSGHATRKPVAGERRMPEHPKKRTFKRKRK